MSVTVSNISLEVSFQPTWPNFQAYQGDFYSSDDLLNKIWYSGEYTVQMNIIAPATGQRYPIVAGG